MDVFLIRHAAIAAPPIAPPLAPAITSELGANDADAVGPRLYGQTDVPADMTHHDAASPAIVGLQQAVGDVDLWITSPAQRCRTTAQRLASGENLQEDPRLWEQNFGAWEGFPLANLPDLGPLSAAELADHAPPGGESFRDVCARVTSALHDIHDRAHHRARENDISRIAIVTHAGVVRAALALALGHVPSALAFEVAPLSLTHIRLFRASSENPKTQAGGGAIVRTNWKSADVSGRVQNSQARTSA